jgi:type IV pilus biogenesis protein CpaD/CtpE
MRTIIRLAVLLALPLAACSNFEDSREGEMSPDAGQAVRHNITAQIVNPNAPSSHGAFVTDGERAFQAIDRYSKGKVIPPASISTSNKGGDNDGSASADNKSDKP